MMCSTSRALIISMPCVEYSSVLCFNWDFLFLHSTVESEDDDDDGPVMIQVPVVRSSGSPAASPSKRGIIVRSRKRKRRYDIDATDAASKYHRKLT